MGKFDWGKFGSALATNVGNTGQQFFMNKMLQEEEDKRAYTKSQVDALVNLYKNTGNMAYVDQLEKLGREGQGYAQTFRKAPLPTMEEMSQRELEQKRKELELQKEINPPAYKPPTQEEAVEFERKKWEAKGGKEKAMMEELDFLLKKYGLTEKVLNIKRLEEESKGKTLPAGVLTDMTQTENTEELLNEWKSLYDMSKGRGYKWVGPVSGRVGGAEETFAGGRLEEGQADFYALEARVKNMVIKEITGAQLGEKEAERIMKEIPARNMPSEVWEARFRQTMKNIKRIRKIKEKKFKGAGYRLPEGNQNLPKGMPPAQGNEGRPLIDKVTKKKYVSDGTTWNEVQ